MLAIRLHQRNQLRLRLWRRHSRFQPPEQIPVVRPSPARFTGSLHRRPHLRRIALSRRKLKTRRHHANNRRLLPIEHRLVPEDVRIAAKHRLPRTIRNIRHQRRARRIIRRGDQPPHHRRNSQRLQQRAAHIRCRHAYRLRLASQVGPLYTPRIQRRPRIRVLLQIKKFRRRSPEPRQPTIRKSRELCINAHQLFWMGIGKWPQQNRVHHSENASGCSDAQHKAEHRRRREPKILPHHPQCKPQILFKRLHQCPRLVFRYAPRPNKFLSISHEGWHAKSEALTCKRPTYLTSQLAKLVHKETHPALGRPNRFCPRASRNQGHALLRLSFIPISRHRPDCSSQISRPNSRGLVRILLGIRFSGDSIKTLPECEVLRNAIE